MRGDHQAGRAKGPRTLVQSRPAVGRATGAEGLG